MPMPSFFMPRNALLAASAPSYATFMSDGHDFRQWGIEPGDCGSGAHMSECLAGRFRREAGATAERAGDRAKALEKSALGRAELADQIATDRNALGSRLNQLGQPSSPDANRRREALLAQPYRPQAPGRQPEASRALGETMQKLGLSTQRDLWQRGPGLREQLLEVAEAEAKQSLHWFQQENLSKGAGAELARMQGKAETYRKSMASVPGKTEAKGFAAGQGSPDGKFLELSAKNLASADTKRGDELALAKGPPDGVMAWQGEAGATKSARGLTVRDLLRAKLAAATARDDKAASESIARELAAAEEGGKAEAPAGEDASRSLASAAAAGDALPASRSGFAFGSDDERAVRSTIEQFEAALSSRGSASEADDGRSLFQRVTASIRSSVAAGRLQ